MYSPYDAVRGHDTTYIQRMTVDEYVKELQEEEADVRGENPTSPMTTNTARQQENRSNAVKAAPGVVASPQLSKRSTPRTYEQRRIALSSRNPNVVFSSKYPMYDRLGHELCVAYQIQDMAVQQELRRLQVELGHGEYDSRRSGVRLSAELPVGSDGTTTTTATTATPLTRPSSLAETQPPSLAEGRELAYSEEASRLVRPSHMDGHYGDSPVDIEVSATSHYPSVSASRTSSRPASARPSEFSIFRESGAVGDGRGGFAGKARSSIPVRAIAEEDKILIHRASAAGGARGGLLRALSMPSAPTTYARGAEEDDEAHRTGEGRRMEWRHHSEKRRRSRSSGGRHSCVRFISEEGNEENVNPAHPQPQSGRGVGSAAAPPPKRLLTPPPVPLSEPEPTRLEDAAPQEEATRWTTLTRGSAAVRATKQLFRGTTHSATAPSRMTTTLTYTQPIPSTAYGISAGAIAASKVRGAVEQNVVACAAAMPQHYTHGFAAVEDGAETRRRTPELHCGAVVQLGDAWYRLVHFHVVAEVFEAVQVQAPPAGEQKKNATGTEVGEAGVANTAPEKEPTATASEEGSGTPPPQTSAPEIDTSVAAVPSKPPLTPQTAHKAQPATSSQQFFVYRWRTSDCPHGVDEARRAALGLSLCAPDAHVTGFDYADGGGVTLVALPAGHHAIPISGLPLSLRSYTTLLRTVLKSVSAMVARRTVHGNVAALGDVFLVWSVEEEKASSPPAVGVVETPRLDGADGRSRDPYVALFHWEHWVDFGMFVDRNAGRTLPFDFEDNSAQPLVLYSRDILSGLQLFLEHSHAAELTSEQYILLQKLIVMAAESTPVASYLIQMKNLMLTLPTDTAALQQSFETALVHYTP